MASTYTPIATTTLGSDQASVTFSSIPSTYTDLILVTNEKQSGARVSAIQLNSDTGTNYSWTELYGTGSAAGSSRSSSTARIYYGYNAGYSDSTNFDANAIIHIMNYANSTTYKTVLIRANNATNGTDATVGLWRSTAAINTIYLYMDNLSNYKAGSTFTLYGIKAA